MTLLGKLKLGDGTYKMLLGEELKAWCQAVDNALNALYNWGATGVAPGPTGGISPFPKTPALVAWSDNNMSSNHKLD